MSSESLLCCCAHYFFDSLTGIQHVLFGKSRMHKEHQARVPQLVRNLPALLWAQFLWERFFKMDFAANSAETRNAFRVDRGHDFVPILSRS